MGGSERSLFYDRGGKRAFDIAVVVAFAPIWLTIYVIVAAVLLLVQGRPIHFTSRRTGRNCETFPIIKFRSMRPDAEQVLEEILRQDPELAAEYHETNKLKDDPRISKLGSFLRKTSLDELPQLWNVLRGDMSLVGPRPPSTVGDTDLYYGPLARYVFRDRPGLTGLWQVSERHVTTYERKVWLDLVYANQCNFASDARLLFKTVPTVIFGRGAY